MEEENKKIKARLLIAPFVSIAAFLILIFGAGYAYFTSTITMNSANYQINMPSQTSLICTKQDCGVTITPAQMLNTAVDSTTAKGTSTCSVTCECTGTAGATCTYSVSLKQTGAAIYGSNAAVSVNNEFTTAISKTGVCNLVTANVNTNAAFYPAAAKTIATCTLTAGDSTKNVSTVTSVFKWYNLDGNQTPHANKSYSYRMETSGGTVG